MVKKNVKNGKAELNYLREFLNQEEASVYLGVSKKTLQKFVLMGLPKYEYGARRKFYKKSEMDDFMKRFCQQSPMLE